MRSLLSLVALSMTMMTRAPAQAPASDTLPKAIRAARESLAAGQVDAAIDLAQRFVSSHPKDPSGFLALGDAYAEKIPDGRFRALDAYREAKRLSPNSPEPAYQMAQVGLRLGGADGERIVRENLQLVLSMDPTYRNAWDQWLLVYRNGGSRSEMIDILRRHPEATGVREHIAQLLIENEEYLQANALIDSVLATDSSGSWLALRAQSALEMGDSGSGMMFYRRALANAATDSVGILWRQIIGIAAPSEIVAWSHGIPPTERGPWLESFWARRQPDLFNASNERIAEHFSRLRYARKHFPLLHPFILYQRNGVARALNLEPSTDEREFHLRCETATGAPGTGPVGAEELSRLSNGPFAQFTREEIDSLRSIRSLRFQPAPNPTALAYTIFAPLNLDLRSVDTVAARIGYNLATGLDDRGIMFLRFGAPDHVRYGGDNVTDPRCTTDEVERWTYPGIGEVRFAKPSAFGGSTNVTDMVYRPMDQGQFEAMTKGLTSDATSRRADLNFGVWVSQFRHLGDALSDLEVITTTGAAAAALVGTTGGELDTRESEQGVVTLTAPPGRYTLLADAKGGDSLGRQTLTVTLRSFAPGITMSDLLLGVPWDSGGIDRPAILAHVQRDLTFRAGATVRTYCEIYGLPAPQGIARYRVSYEILRSRDVTRDIALATWPGARSLVFDRQIPAAPGRPIVESLDVSPDQLPTGQYLLRVRIMDSANGVEVGHSTVALQVR